MQSLILNVFIYLFIYLHTNIHTYIHIGELFFQSECHYYNNKSKEVVFSCLLQKKKSVNKLQFKVKFFQFEKNLTSDASLSRGDYLSAETQMAIHLAANISPWYLLSEQSSLISL